MSIAHPNEVPIINFVLDEKGDYIGFYFENNLYYYVRNLQNDVVGISDTLGNVIVTYSYDPWGKATSVTGNTYIGNANPIRYRGYFYDTETQLYYLQSRYYDPESNRFINADEASVVTVSPDSANYDKNLYAYCDNNPVVRADEGGAFWDTVFDVVSLVSSAIEVVKSPKSAKAWASLAVDAACLIIPGVTGGGAIVKAASKFLNKADDVVDVVKTSNKIETTIETTVNGFEYTDKVIKQMDNAKDLHHSFPSLIDTFVDVNSGRPFIGGDGVIRQKIEIPGYINKTPGVFEYIIEPNGLCNHRYFKELR